MVEHAGFGIEMLFIGKQLKQARQLIRRGELNLACRITRQTDFNNSTMGRRIAKQLIDRLVDRAGRSSLNGDLNSAWQDLIDASSIASQKYADLVSREKSRLVDRTIDFAQSLLLAGKPTSASKMVNLLSTRSIRDRRANELTQVCEMISQAEQLAAMGKLNDATSLLCETKQLRPDLTFLDSRIRNFGYQQSQLSDLTTELRFAINQSAWGGAQEVSNKILRIAPNHQVALDAQRRCDTKQANAIKSIRWLNEDDPKSSTDEKNSIFRMLEKRSQPDSATNAETGDAETETDFGTAAETDTSANSNAKTPNDTKPSLNETRYDSTTNTSRPNEAVAESSVTESDDEFFVQPEIAAAMSTEKPTQDNSGEHDSRLMKSFMLWIDGVGGFLVCTNPLVTIGRAKPGARIDIPVQADLRREHLQIKRLETQYLVSQPSVETTEGEIDWQLLADDQQVDLGHGVEIRFKQTHPLGRSARIEFTSRHRTEPWSDAVLLLGDAILMGPDRSNHVYCSRWKDQLVIYRRGNQILLRSQGDQTRLEVDGVAQAKDILLQDGLQITGDEFSISCEEVS